MAYIGARTDTTQHSGQTPDNTTHNKTINNIIVSDGGYTETDPTCLLSTDNRPGRFTSGEDPVPIV
jgi:hypothetical protein